MTRDEILAEIESNTLGIIQEHSVRDLGNGILLCSVEVLVQVPGGATTATQDYFIKGEEAYYANGNRIMNRAGVDISKETHLLDVLSMLQAQAANKEPPEKVTSVDISKLGIPYARLKIGEKEYDLATIAGQLVSLEVA